MLNMGRRDRFDTKELESSTVKSPPFSAGGMANGPLSEAAATRTAAAPYGGARPTAPQAAAPTPAHDALAKPGADPAAAPAIGPDMPGSRLCVGPKIKLKGVEISDCDVLVVEGEVEATVNSKAMQIAQPGMLRGRVSIDVAEIFGEFSGELTARAKLIVHSTGRVAGTIRYGKLVVAEGGELSGDVQRLDATAEVAPAKKPAVAAHAAHAPHAPHAQGSDGLPLLSPQTTR
jgi:cytoskeletal protein CcmA (bactofilin family)